MKAAVVAHVTQTLNCCFEGARTVPADVMPSGVHEDSKLREEGEELLRRSV